MLASNDQNLKNNFDFCVRVKCNLVLFVLLIRLMLASGCFLETWEPTPALQLPLSMDSINHPSIIPFPRAAGKLKHEKKKNKFYIIIALQHSLLAAKLLKLKYPLVDTLEAAFQLLRGWGFI